jgi:hypothetical protein
MKIFNDLHPIPDGFPTFPAYSAEWRAVRFELSPGTGEWITSHIALRDKEGIAVKQIINISLLRAMFGGHAKHFQSLLSMVENSLEDYLIMGGSLSNWNASIEGFSATTIKIAHARMGRIEALRMAVKQSTALCAIEDFDLPINTDELEDEAGYWSGRIKKAVIEIRPDLNQYFDKTGMLYSDSVRFGFLTDTSGAHFANILPSSIAQSMRMARGKIQELRAGSKTLNLTIAKLVAGAPRQDDITNTEKQLKAISRALDELRQEAEENKIDLDIVNTVEEAVDSVLAMAE